MKQTEPEKQTAFDSQLSATALQLLREALGTWVEVGPAARDSGVDAVMQLPDRKTIKVQLKGLDTRQELPSSDDHHTIFVLQRATRRLHDELRSEGLSFVDTSGTVHLALPSLLVDRTNLRPRARRGTVRQRFDAFSDRGSLVARRLLEEADRAERIWGVRELAAAAGVSAATVTRVLRELERHAAVQVDRRGRTAAVRLTNAAALFTAWTRAYDWTRNQSVAFIAPMGDVERFLARLTRTWTGPRWALTLQAGAARVAPLATWDRVHVYVDVKDASALVEAGEKQGWEPADDGRVVLMKPYYRTSAWHGLQRIQKVPVVSTLQLALDLWHYPLRGREQAEHLLSTAGLVR